MAKYWKSAIALLSILGTTLAALSANTDFTSVLPNGWAAGLLAAGTVIGTALVWLKRNEPTVTEAEEILQRAKARAVDNKPA